MLRTVASASAVLRRLVLASPRPSILSRSVSAGPVLYRRPDLSVHRFPVSRSFPLALDLSRGYAGGRGKRLPSDEEADGSDDVEIMSDEDFVSDEDFGSDEEETWDDFDKEDFSGKSKEESD